MKTVDVTYNAVLPITGIVKLPEGYDEDELLDAVFEDVEDAVKYRSTIKQLELVDTHEPTY
jgi:hypothetical protein|tara:strand:- start:1480 stop:1662 length:183 start_codon:yes stop_codon:yes gene_type:complete